MKETGQGQGFVTAIGILSFLLIGLFLVERHAETTAVRVDGLVIAKHTDQNLLGSSRPQRLVVAYTVGGERRNLVTGRGLAEKLSGNLEPGARVPVLVAHDNPNRAKLATPYHVYGTTIGIALLMTLTIAGRVAIYVRDRVRRRTPPPAQRAA